MHNWRRNILSLNLFLFFFPPSNSIMLPRREWESSCKHPEKRAISWMSKALLRPQILKTLPISCLGKLYLFLGRILMKHWLVFFRKCEFMSEGPPKSLTSYSLLCKSQTLHLQIKRESSFIFFSCMPKGVSNNFY